MSEQAKCPKCEQRGGVIARKDAYVNHPLAADGTANWEDTSDVTQFDHTVFECVLCNEELEQSEIERVNNCSVGGPLNDSDDSESFVVATYVSEWDNGTTIRSRCKFDGSKLRCYDIEQSDTDPGDAKLLEEYVETGDDSFHEVDGVTFDY